MSAQTEFIAKIAPLIQAEAKKRGYKVCSAVIAQACVESNYGKSKLSASYHNYFGLKCGSAWTGPSVNMSTKEEYKVGTLTTIKDFFRVYPDMAAGVAGYYDFISTKRYANLKDAVTAVGYLSMIKADGYATSSTYVTTNMNVVTKYDLTKYDSMEPVKESVNYTVGKVYTTLADLRIRVSPNGARKDYCKLTSDAKNHAIEDEDESAILLKGTRVTCKGIEKPDKAVWMKIPSGYICAVSGEGKKYVE